MKSWMLVVVIAMGWMGPAMAYESMYPRTDSGEVELKKLPERRALVAAGRGTYFQAQDGVFMKLFRYIQKHKVSMTVPVEAEVKDNRMRFFSGADVANRDLPNDGPVQVEVLPARTVVSAGIRGAYTQENYERGLAEAQTWLQQHADQWQADGEPYAVYWNSPFVPGLLKRSEIHLPVVAK